jgi:pre-mRNA-splicing factor ATP-dependent RNA helicase DHX15/PRP43
MNENNDNNEIKKIEFKKGIFDTTGKYINPLNDKPFTDTYKNLAKFWSNLPAYKNAKDIVKTIIKNDVILIQSATGSGKSVLIPKYCLHANDYSGLIMMTLPKKLITKSTAEFSAKCLDVEIGEQVGYQFRGETIKSDKTNLLYCTDGSVVAMIKNDLTLKTVDILIIDEAHERKVQIDLLLYLVKNAIKIRKERNMRPLKLIIMSATINENLFSVYYKDFLYDYLFLSGTPNYPIETRYLEFPLKIENNQYLEEGKKIILNIVKRINLNDNMFPDGDILFFVCTVSECEKMTLELEKLLNDCFVMAVYSGFDTELEKYLSNPTKFKELNPNFKRRIFVSTNVAESSITLDGITWVIDSGLEMSVKYDPIKQCNVMNKNIITKAQISQRRGRAGRTKSGFCYHLFTPEQEQNAKEFPEPEILKEDLKNVSLSLMKLGCQMNKIDFTMEQTIQLFLEFIEPPLEKFIIDGFDYNIKYGLIKNNILSDIGQLVVESRLDVCDGLTLLYAFNISSSVFKKVFKIICIQSSLKHGINDFFHNDIDNKKKDKIISQFLNDSNNSEHLLIYHLYEYIKSNHSGLFDNHLIKDISRLYNNQIDRMEKIFKKRNIEINTVNKKDVAQNIICAFNYGLQHNKCIHSKNNFKYNNINCDLSKSVFKYEKYSSIVFYSNLFINGNLNIVIVSPWILN